MKIYTLITQADGSKQYQDPSPWHAGDCTFIGPAGPDAPWSGPLITVNPNGTGNINGFGSSTDGNDTWKWHLELMDAAQNILAHAPPHLMLFGTDAPADWEYQMGDSHTWYSISRDFNFDPALFARVVHVMAYCDC